MFFITYYRLLVERAQKRWSELCGFHSRPHRPYSFRSTPRSATSGRVRFSEHAQRIRFVLSANQICQTCHAHSDGKSVNRGLPVLDPARGRDSCGDQMERGLWGRECVGPECKR